MTSYEEALKKVLDKTSPLGTEEVDLLRSLGRVLAEDAVAREPIPPFRKATMDGYAVRTEDLKDASEDSPVVLEVIEDLPAGRIAKETVKPKTAIRIMTGAPLPKGADAVVMVEDTKKKGKKVFFWKKPRVGENIGEAGEDVKKGEVVIDKGELIGPAQMGMLASMGYSRVKVYKKPKVAIIATGDEIVEPSKKLSAGKIRNANGYSLFGLAVRSGADAKYLGIARDKKSELKKKINLAKGFDVLLISGGVSVGDYDLVKDQLQEFGVSPVFWQARIKPGKPIFFGKKKKQLVFGLPGNPVSSMVTFYLFVRPALDKLQGKKQIGLRKGRAILKQDLKLKPGRKQFLRAKLDESGVVRQVDIFPDQKSGVLKSMVKSDVLVVVPHHIETMERGEEVEILYLD